MIIMVIVIQYRKILECTVTYSKIATDFYRLLTDCPGELSTLEATKELMNSDNYFVSIQLLRFILSCLNLRNNLLSIQTDVT